MEDWLGITRIENNGRGQATKVTYPDGKEVSYTYGKAGERTGIIYPDGREVTYAYDEALRLRKLRDKEQEISYHYKQGHLVGKIAKTKENQLETRYDYNHKGLLNSLTHRQGEEILDAYSYTYNALGFKTKVTKERKDYLEDSGTYEYTYDPLGRLEEVRKDTILQSKYVYDSFGNRIQKKTPNGNTRYQYNGLNQLMTQREEGTETSLLTEYTYDKRGNLSSIAENGVRTQEYFFGALNRLEKVVNLKSGKGAAYQYNGLGHRTGKVEGSPTSPILPTTKIAELELNPTKQIEDVIDLTRGYHNLLERSEGTNLTSFTWDGNVVSMTGQGNATYSYLQDDLGSPIRVLGNEGEEVYGYDEFGIRTHTERTSHVISSSQPFTYTGYQADEVARSYYAQMREYRPEVGRFVSEDSVKGFTVEPVTMNQYNYCFNNPMIYIDENGAFGHLFVGAIIGAVGG